MFQVIVRKGRQFGVYVIDGNSSRLLEGGFFTRAAAEASALLWTRELLQDAAESAEAKAGWDAHP